MSDSIYRQNAIEGVKELFACADIGNDEYDITYMLENLPSADRPKNMIHIDEVYRLIAGHSNYHGDSILSAFTCLVEGKDVKPIAPLDESADRPTGEWISEELANMICNEICYYKEVTVDTNSLNDLCEGCLIEKMKYGRPIGKWIKSDILPNGWHCSHCDSPVMTDDISEMLFCPNCGSYNGGEEE